MRVRADFDYGTTFINGQVVEFRNGLADVSKRIFGKMIDSGTYIPALKKQRTISSCKHALFIRGSGLGDILMMAPVFRHVRKLYKGIKISLFTDKRFSPVYQGSKLLERAMNYKNVDMSGVDCCVNFNRKEFSFDFSIRHKVDLLASVIGITSVPDKKLEYHLEDEEVAWAIEHIGDVGGIVGLVPESSCGVKHMRVKKLVDICSRLSKAGIRTMIFARGKPNYKPFSEFKGCMSGCGFTIRQAAALLYCCDVVFTPDTGIMHLANVVNHPTVLAYFGGIGHELVVTPGRIKCILPKIKCYPCNAFKCHAGGPKCLDYDTGMLTERIKGELK